jgi:hypothetical protein
MPHRDAGILLTFADMLSMAVTICVSDVRHRHAQVGPGGDGFGGRIAHTAQDDSQLFLARRDMHSAALVPDRWSPAVGDLQLKPSLAFSTTQDKRSYVAFTKMRVSGVRHGC